MQRRMNPRDTRRMISAWACNMEGVNDVEEVIIRTPTKEIVIAGPEVAIVNVQGQKIYQVVGGDISERAPQRAAAPAKVSEEDAQLVASQTGKSLEQARQALEESEGDLAKAILLLQS